MKKILASTFLLFFSVFILGGCPSSNLAPIIQPNPNPPSAQANKRYFGYFASQMDGMGTTAEIKDLTQVSNFVFIASSSLEEKFVECEKQGIKAMVAISGYFFDADMRLRADYATAFKVDQPIFQKYRSTIIAFYGLDEPYLNGRLKGRTVDEMYQAQQTMFRFLKSQFPEIPSAVIYTTDALKDNCPMPSENDWFGFDCYQDFYKCEGWSVPVFQAMLKDKVKALVQADGKPRYLMSVPPSGWDMGDPKQSEDHTASQAPLYENMIINDPMVKVVLPFLWQSLDNGTTFRWRGTRDLPKARAAYLKFYQNFTK